MFSIKHLESLLHFLGIEVIPTKNNIFFLSEGKYIHDLFKHKSMLGAKNIQTLLSTFSLLTSPEGSNLVDVN